MQAEKARLKRLLRLEKLRAIAKQTLAAEAAQAEGTLAQLEALAARTSSLAAEYGARSEARDGAALQQLGRFSLGLQGISANTAGDAVRARAIADSKMAELAAAERRRAAVEDRADKTARGIANRSVAPILGMRRSIGTGLE
jgi:hypothetical protein